MVVAGVGVDHQRLVDATYKYFVEKPPIWSTDEKIIQMKQNIPVDNSISQYTGGIIKVS